MKNLFTILTILFSVLTLNASVWRVNNLPGTDADFTTIQQAHDAPYVYDGDTLYLEGSSGSYGDLNASKRLVIIGAGYFLAENNETQANINSSNTGAITFNNGSQGSIITGCNISRIIVNTSNLIIERNHISNSNMYYGIWLNSDNINNVIIRSNYIIVTRTSTYTTTYGIRANYIGSNNITIRNNYIQLENVSIQSRYALGLYSGFSGIVENNVLVGRVNINNTSFNNNILVEGTFEHSNSFYHNNIANSTQFGTLNGNQQNVFMGNVFLGETGNSTDGQWQLKAGSAAIGAGVDGVDCGMFGGQFPYKLSGLPGIPAIYHHEQTIDNVNQVLNVTINAKSHD